MYYTDNWPFIDTPWDLLLDCYHFKQGWSNASLPMCQISVVIGIFSSIIFPIIGGCGFFLNLLVGYIFLIKIKKPTRQLIYLGNLSLTDSLTIFLFGFLWLFPAKGLPFITNGNVYYFTFYKSRYLCRLHRFAYSFTSSLSSNLLLLTAIDRCLSVYYPLKFSKLPHFYARNLVIVMVLFSCLIMLPFALLIDWNYSQGLITCWVERNSHFLPIYHTLFSNSSLFQKVVMVFVNLALTIKLVRITNKREKFNTIKKQNRPELSASIVLLIVSGIAVVAALPQSIAYLIADYLLTKSEYNDLIMGPIRMAYNVSDIGWHFLLIQESINFFIYLWRMKIFRKELSNLFLIKYINSKDLSRCSHVTKIKNPLENKQINTCSSFYNINDNKQLKLQTTDQIQVNQSDKTNTNSTSKFMRVSSNNYKSSL